MLSLPLPTKTCTRCGLQKPATTEYWSRAKRGKFGLQAVCKDCLRTERAVDAPIARARTAAWRTANPVRARESMARANAQRRTAHRKYHHEWYIRNSETVRARVANYQRENRAKVYAAKARRRAEAPHIHRASARRRKALLRNAPGTHTAQDVLAQYQRQQGRCWWCAQHVSALYHVDHVIPLARGGANDASNIVIACPRCNCSRKDKLPEEWRNRPS